MAKAEMAPDGGWGWLVVFGSFLLQAVTVGITYTFGVLYVELLEHFGQGISATAWIGSIQPAMLYFVGIFTGPLLKKYGWRWVILAGTCISTTGFGLSCLATDIYILYVTYGGLTGFGFGLMFVTSIVIIQHYFESRRSMATGIAAAGSGVGTLTFGFLTQILLDNLGWKLTLITEGGITLVVGVVCAILFRPLPPEEQEETEPILSPNNETRNLYNTFSADTQPEVSPSSSRSSPTPLSGEPSPTAAATHSLAKQLDYRTTPPLPNIEEDTETSVEQPRCCCPCCLDCVQKFHLDLCRDPRLIMFCVTIIFFCFGYHVPYTFTPARAIETYEVKPNLAAFLVSIMGISNVVFRLFFGWIGDRSERIRFVLMGGVLVLCGVNSILSFLYTSYALLVVYSSLFGAFSGCFASMYPVVMVDLMGLDVIEYTLGLGMASTSIAFLVASPLSGWVVQITGGYNTAFVMVGGGQIIGGLVFFTIWCLPKRTSGCHYEDLTASEEAAARRASRVSSRRSSFMNESLA